MIICPNMSNPDVAREFNEIKDAIENASPGKGEVAAYQIWSLNNGNAIDKAPNGAESQLFKSLVDYYEGNRSKAIVAKAKTYSTDFLKWFGNWTGEEGALPEFERGEVSKVVDENGEPLLVYHNSKENKITVYDMSMVGSNGGHLYGPGIYASADRDYNSVFGDIENPLYMNIKAPFYQNYDPERSDNAEEQDLFIEQSFQSNKIPQQFKEKYDGSIADDVSHFEYIAWDPNQIKSAISNKQDIITEGSGFSTEDDNIYHNRGEKASDIEEESVKYYTWLGHAKIRLEQVSAIEQERVKDELVQEFNSLGFKHFEIHPMYSKPSNKWYIATRNNIDKKDIQDLRKLAKEVGYTESGVHTFSNDQLETLLRFLFSQTHGESQHMRDVCNILWYALKHRTIKIQFVENSYKDSPAFYDHETGIITVNINGAFINSNGYSNIAAQTILHELLHAVTVDTIKHSPELRQQLQKLFDRVKDHGGYSIFDGRNDTYGMTDMYEFLAELSNEDFVKTLQNISYVSDKSLLQTIYEFIKTVAAKILSRVLKEHRGTAYADAMEILVKAALPKGFKLELQEKPLDEQTIFHIISQRQQAAQDEANRLITRMNVLHRQYEKIKDKTPSQERLANQIFETYNKLKQHRDISAIGIALEQAKLTLGQYDESTGGPVNVSSIYKYLFDAAQNDFDGVSAQNIVDMYRNSIKFYKDLIDNIPSDQVIDLTSTDKRNIEQLKNLIDTHIMPLIVRAMMITGDKIVDDTIDSEVFASEENKEDMKKVAKDWLHKNLMYGDINAATSYVYNYSNSSNPIIKQAFHLIQQAEQRTLEEMHHIAPAIMKAYQKANKGDRSFTPGWQSMMMEFDDENKPTGNFIRDINYGQYQKDLQKFIENLNKDFLNRYDFTYVTDDSGIIINSLTGEYAEDEEWGPNGEKPKYIEYLESIEKFKGQKDSNGNIRIHRRYTPKYYLERISRPYDGTIDPESPEFTDTRFNHGLSPKTLSRYTYYQSNINYYLNKCQDPTTGLVYPERLSYDDQLSLDKWKTRMDEFTSIFNTDGSYKDGEDLKMAYEVRAWQKWIGQYSDSAVLQDKFNEELANIRQKAQSTNNPRLYNDFVRYNSQVGINPDYILQTIGSMKSYKNDTDLSFRGKILRTVLQDMVKNPRTFGRQLDKMIHNPLFWLHCKASDQAVEDANDPDNKSGWDIDKVEEFGKSFYQKDILYIDPQGFYVDDAGNSISPNNPNAKALEEAGKLLTFRQYLINTYVNEALQNGFVDGLIDESTGINIDFSGLSESDIRKQIVTLLSYTRRVYDEDGELTDIVYEPLTIFSILSPTEDTFFNTRTHRNEPTIIFVGTSRFKDSTSSFTDRDYNPNEGIAEKPDRFYDGGAYDNSEAYNEVVKDDNVKELYDLLIQTMQDAQSIYSTNRKFNYKLPQINAHSAALFSRLIKRGYTEKSLKAIWESMTTIEANDDRLRTKQDYFMGPDGEIANDVPLKFIRDLKNKEDLSTDLVSSVIMFADMALNYKNKSEIDSKLKILRYNLDKNVRDVYETKLKPKSEQAAKENDNSVKMFDSMMDTSMYGNKFSTSSGEGPSKTRVMLHKTADAFQSLESSAMLGLNIFSMSVGFADSITRIFSESVAGKYMTPGDCLWALGKVLWYTPQCIINMFNPLANNKMTALMQMNGISKGTFGIYTKTDWGKGRKFLSNLLMGGWSMLDWMANALLMMAFYHNCRFYDGDVVPKGFYTKYELQQAFVKAGHSKSEANLVHDGYSILPPGYNKDTFKTYTVQQMDEKGNTHYKKIRGGVSLWDAYEFAPYVKDDEGNVRKLVGEVVVRKEYEQYVTQRVKTNIATKTKKRGALYNGMNPDNDVPRWKRDVLGRLAGALRGWIVQQFQHLVAGGTDNISRQLKPEVKYETTSSGTRAKTVYKKQNLTDEQRSRRMAWDYETGTPQDQILIGLWRSIQTMFRMAKQALLHKPRTAKLSEIEKYAWKDSLIFMGMLAMMMVGWIYIHDDAREVKKPTSRKQAGPASMFNPIDYYEYVRDVYIPNQYWKLAVDDIYFRTVEAKISNINPQQVLDIVNALTALKSGLDDQLGVFGIASDVINGENTDEVLKQGAYKFYTKGERSLYRAVGPAKNMHTFLTYYGATNNLRWYTNKFGTFYRAVGYDFKAKDKESSGVSKKSGIKLGTVSKSGGIKLGRISKSKSED